MPVIDTLRLKNRLSENGMPDQQAQVLVEELDGGLTTTVGQLANKDDVTLLRGAIKDDMTLLRDAIAAVNVRLGKLEAQAATLRWMIGTVGAGVLAILVRLFFISGP